MIDIKETRECFGCEILFVAEHGEEYCSDECAASFEDVLRAGVERAKEIGIVDANGNPIFNETTFNTKDLNNFAQKFNIKIKS